MRMSQYLVLFLLVLSLPQGVWGFPEMVRHGYSNCISCHVSPTGGGVLTQYGRELSREVLSSRGSEGESDFAYRAVRPPSWLNLGGDLRGMGYYRDTPRFSQGQLTLMQADLEAAMTYKKLTAVGTLGYQNSPRIPSIKDSLISRRHYLNYRPTDELSIRAGRFQAAYGINLPDHAVTTKRGLGWNESTETYNFETAWIGELFNLYVTGVLGRPDAPELNREQGVAMVSSVSFDNSSKVGMSYFYGANSLGGRHLTGPFGVLGFSPHFFLLVEFDFQSLRSSSFSVNSQFGFVNYQRLDYEFVQGFHGYLTQELSRLNFSDSDSLSKIFGIGIQYFPRPHFELNLSWQIQTHALRVGYADFAFLMLHFYP